MLNLECSIGNNESETQFLLTDFSSDEYHVNQQILNMSSPTVSHMGKVNYVLLSSLNKISFFKSSHNLRFSSDEYFHGDRSIILMVV